MSPQFTLLSGGLELIEAEFFQGDETYKVFIEVESIDPVLPSVCTDVGSFH
jgi:hypothetical protein